jgi:hypothetical protein
MHSTGQGTPSANLYVTPTYEAVWLPEEPTGQPPTNQQPAKALWSIDVTNRQVTFCYLYVFPCVVLPANATPPLATKKP